MINDEAIEKIRDILKNDFGYEESDIEVSLERLGGLDSLLVPILDKYLLDNTIEDVEIEGFSLKKLMLDKNLNFFAGLLMMDMLIKLPEEAKEVIGQ